MFNFDRRRVSFPCVIISRIRASRLVPLGRFLQNSSIYGRGPTIAERPLAERDRGEIVVFCLALRVLYGKHL